LTFNLKVTLSAITQYTDVEFGYYELRIKSIVLPMSYGIQNASTIVEHPIVICELATNTCRETQTQQKTV